MKSTSVAIIPARGGSKRIPRKNILPLGGKPIIAHSIRAAIDSGLFERVVVSTDSEEIAAVARQWGAEVPFVRNANLADDFTPVSEVTADALDRFAAAGERFDHVAQLMANCPLRNAADVIDSYRQFEKTAAETQISLTRFGWQNPWWAMQRNAEFRLESIFPKVKTARSQDLPELFCPTGAIWWAKTEILSSARTFYAQNVRGWEIPWQRGIDIDTAEDWAQAEFLMQHPPLEQ